VRHWTGSTVRRSSSWFVFRKDGAPRRPRHLHGPGGDSGDAGWGVVAPSLVRRVHAAIRWS
jgi:hypothetical protein